MAAVPALLRTIHPPSIHPLFFHRIVCESLTHKFPNRRNRETEHRLLLVLSSQQTLLLSSQTLLLLLVLSLCTLLALGILLSFAAGVGLMLPLRVASVAAVPALLQRRSLLQIDRNVQRAP